MTNEHIKYRLAPCGLCCETCFAHVDGDIRTLSLKLKEKLGDFDLYAQRFETLLDNPIFKKYAPFKAMLDYFASENCTGCRNEPCALFRDCGVRSCHREKQIDFCCQCDKFPCNTTNFDTRMYKTWVAINRKIKKIGLERYAETVRNSPRYGSGSSVKILPDKGPTIQNP